MKTVFRFSGALLLAFTILACNKSNGPANTILTGSWVGFNFQLKNCVDPGMDTDGPCKCDTLVFKSNTFADVGYDSDRTGTYSVKENNLTLTYAGNSPIVATYTLISDTLTLTFPALSNSEPNNGCVEITKSVKLK